MTEQRQSSQRRRSPQEKKALSYARDRRNSYDANDKASRKNIPLRKRLVNKANRHAQQQDLSNALGSADLAAAEEVETRAAGRLPKFWRKRPDQSLGDYLAAKRRRRG